MKRVSLCSFQHLRNEKNKKPTINHTIRKVQELNSNRLHERETYHSGDKIQHNKTMSRKGTLNTLETLDTCEKDNILLESVRDSNKFNLVASFSDLRKAHNNFSNRRRYDDKVCQNHPHCIAEYYVQQSEPKIIHYYCKQCAQNLNRAGFTIYIINKLQDNNVKQIQQLTVIKQVLQRRQKELQLNFGLVQVESYITQTEQKYNRILACLEKMKEEQLMSLQAMKIRIIEAISEQESKLNAINKKVDYLLAELKKKDTNGMRLSSKDMVHHRSRSYERIYTESIDKIKRQLKEICEFGFSQHEIYYDRKSINEICQKIEAQYIRLENLQTENESSQQISNELANYLFKQYKPNATFGRVDKQRSGYFSLPQLKLFNDEETMQNS